MPTICLVSTPLYISETKVSHNQSTQYWRNIHIYHLKLTWSCCLQSKFVHFKYVFQVYPLKLRIRTCHVSSIPHIITVSHNNISIILKLLLLYTILYNYYNNSLYDHFFIFITKVLIVHTYTANGLDKIAC